MQMAEETGEVKTQEWRGTVGKMSEDELAAFLSGNPFCRIGCVDEEGWPYVVPCWFEYSDGGFYIIPRAKSAWARYIQKDRRVSLCIDDTTIYNNRVLVKGEATILEEPNIGGRWVEIATRMSVRYLGEHGPQYLEPTLTEPRWLLFVKPLQIKTWRGVDWAPKYKHSKW
jgi:nitroimidazol reductase NimA-like FMN-containing flavoprotein (pyridoxamine 5'-phosphate oxidase superfamily)